eukprot:908379-Pelagomonas_calceolata.AAC.5
MGTGATAAGAASAEALAAARCILAGVPQVVEHRTAMWVYLLSGQVLHADVGSVTMFADPAAIGKKKEGKKGGKEEEEEERSAFGFC